MITAVRRKPRRRGFRLAAAAALSCGGLLAGIGAAATAPGGDPLVCFVDGAGRPVRIGDTVKDRLGREIGWISASQCAPDTARGKLRIVPNVYGPVDPIDVDASLVLNIDRDVVLALSADELDQSRQHARATSPSRSSPMPTGSRRARTCSSWRQPDNLPVGDRRLNLVFREADGRVMVLPGRDEEQGVPLITHT